MSSYVDRPTFFANQNLGDDDLNAVIRYARDSTRRHALGQHSWGIVHGLRLLASEEDGGVVSYSLTPGTAVDGFGRQIVVDRLVRLPEQMFASLSGPAEMLWIGLEEIPTSLSRQQAAICCGDEDEFARILEGHRFRVGPLNSVADRHDPVSLTDGDIEDPRQAAIQGGYGEALACDASLPYQSFENERNNRRWWLPLGLVGWEPGAPGAFRTLSSTEMIKGRTLRRYAGAVAEDILPSDGVIRLRPRERVRDETRSIDDDCFATQLAMKDLTDDGGTIVSNELVSIEGDVRALSDLRLFGGKLAFRSESGLDGGVPLYITRADTGGLSQMALVLGNDQDPSNRLAIGTGEPIDDFVPSIVIQADGRAGIGTEEPHSYLAGANSLVVAGDDAAGVTIATRNISEVGTLAFADGTTGGSELRGFVRYDHGGERLELGAAGEPHLFLSDQGKVGVGIEDPRAGLHVTAGSAVSLSASSGRLVLGEINNANLVMDGNEIQARSSGAEARLDLNRLGGDVRFHGSGGARQRVLVAEEGRIAIGHTTPDSQLHIFGDGPTLTLDTSTSGTVRTRLRFAQEGDERASIYWDRSQAHLCLRHDAYTPVIIDRESMSIGVSTTTGPRNRLHVEGSENGGAGNTDSHIALIENRSSGSNADVLALKVRTTNVGEDNNFITFFDGNGPVGRIEGTAAGVTLETGGADFAERLPRMNIQDEFDAGDVVGVHNGRISRQTSNADAVMVVTSRPAVLGNSSGSSASRSGVGVTFVGQAEVRVTGQVNPGDYLVPSGDHDGTAIAVSARKIEVSQLPQLVGRAWSPSNRGKVNAAIGISGTHGAEALGKLIELDRREVTELRNEIAQLKAAITDVMGKGHEAHSTD